MSETVRKLGALPDIETTDAKQRNKLVIALTWPALAENLLSTLVSMADTMMVGKLGNSAINAVSLVTQPRFIVFSAFMALGIGSTSLVARAKGENDPEKANRILWQSVLLSTALVLLLCIVMYFSAEWLIRFIAGSDFSEQTIQWGLDYYKIQIYGFPLLGLTYTMNAVLRGVGNTRAAFYSNLAANIINVIFNYCLIEGNLGFPRLEVAGASIATVIGQAVAFGFCLFLLLQGKQFVRINSHIPRRVDTKLCRSITKIGMPALLEQVVMRAGMLLFTLIVTSLGEDAYTTHNIAMNIQSLSFTTGMSFGTAATTLTGQSLGRKKHELAKVYVKIAQRLGYIASFVVSIVLFFFGGAFAALYTDDPAIISMAAGVLKIVALSNATSNARFVYNSALRGAGDSGYTARITFYGILLTRPLVAVLLVYLLKLELIGVWIALVSDAIVCYILARRRWFTDKWSLIKV